MKNLLRILAVAICGFAGTTFASDFNSTVMQANQVLQITVPNDRFLVIRNFTQDGTTPRGIVTATINGLIGNVLAAAIVDPSSMTLEVINNVTIAGPADVTVTCGSGAATACVITYKKDSN